MIFFLKEKACQGRLTKHLVRLKMYIKSGGNKYSDMNLVGKIKSTLHVVFMVFIYNMFTA